MREIQMLDLASQYKRIKSEIDGTLQAVLDSGQFIGGHEVEQFAIELGKYLNVKHVIPCGNGTDALQIALMSLPVKKGDEVLLPSFTYVATAEVIELLGLTPVYVEARNDTFTMDTTDLENKISDKSKVIVPVHLFGQCADMDEILAIAKKNDLFCIEDTAQALGAGYARNNGNTYSAGTMGDFGTTSFFPSKNLGCFGDGGALFTNNDLFAEKAKMIANHGQRKKYIHDLIGCNSRLDAMQAAILRVKLRYLDEFNQLRLKSANYYHSKLQNNTSYILPVLSGKSNHVYHQYTIKINGNPYGRVENQRDFVRDELKKRGIPSMIYYPVPIHLQKAYQNANYPKGSLPVTESLCKSVLSIPIHTELNKLEKNRIVNALHEVETRLHHFIKIKC